MRTKKIALVEDHVVVRKGLKELILKLGPYEVVAEYDNGLDLIRNISTNNNLDLILMDITMPKMDGDQAMEEMKELGVNIPVLVLTLNTDERRVVKLFRAGARGYLEKNCSAKILKEALDQIFEKGFYHNEFLTYSLQHDTPKKKKSERQVILERLSEREREFLKLVCHEEEYTYDQIAGHMNVQHRTVDGYRESIFSKFGIKSKTGLVLFVLKYNLFELLQDSE